MKSIKFFNRKSDGYSYYYRDGILMGCPTFIDGIPDFDNEIPVDEFVEPLSDNEIMVIEEELDKLNI